MCVRYSVWRLARTEWHGYDLSMLLGEIDRLSQLTPRYNAALGQSLPVIAASGLEDAMFGTSGQQGRRLGNARSDKLGGYWRRWLGQRCLVPANGYYEWDADKQPWYFTHRELPVMCLAGLLATDGFVIVTTSATPDLAPVHERMPVVLPPETAADWLGQRLSPEEAAAVAAPLAPGSLTRWRVSRAVGNVRNEGPELMRPIEAAGLFADCCMPREG